MTDWTVSINEDDLILAYKDSQRSIPIREIERVDVWQALKRYTILLRLTGGRQLKLASVPNATDVTEEICRHLSYRGLSLEKTIAANRRRALFSCLYIFGPVIGLLVQVACESLSKNS